MDFEDKKQENTAEEQNTASRDGHTPAGHSDGFQRDYRPRTPRPRIHTTQPRPYGERPNYSASADDGAFRPEGFGAGLQGGGQQRGYRPRIHSGNNGGGGYQPRQQQGYGQQRPSYNNNKPYNKPYRPYNNPNYTPGQGHGGYTPQEGGEQQGYQPRSYNGGGGYQPRQQQGYGQQRPYNKPYGSKPYGKPYGGGGNAPYGAPYSNSPYRKPYGKKRPSDYDPSARYSMKKRIEYKEEHYDPNEPVRLNKFLANAGVCSRREADEFIQAGVVTVNGEVVTELGTKVLRTDVVKFHEDRVSPEKKVYVLLNKPKDCVTSSDDPQQRKTVMDLVKNACSERIYPVGRLDRNTTGVLLLTNDGDMASKLTHPKFLKKKIYHVYLDKNVTAHDLQRIAEGIQLDDGEIKADDVQYADPVDKKQVGIEIHSGRNRIVRRIFESLGYRVIRLDRVQFAGLTKKNLRRGDWRYLTEEEVDRLRMGAYE